MYPDAFYPSFLRTSIHFMMKIMFCHIKHPLVWLYLIEGLHIIVYFFSKKLWHLNDTDAFRRFRVCYHISALQSLVRFCDGQRSFFKIEICRSERKQFSFPYAAPVKNFKSIKRTGLIHHGVSKFQILLFCPKQHFLVLLTPHISSNRRRI